MATSNIAAGYPFEERSKPIGFARLGLFGNVFLASLCLAVRGETTPSLLAALNSPILFHGDAVTAYRDPLVTWESGIFWMFFTLNTHDSNGTPYWQVAYSTSTDLARWSAAQPITPRDRSLNFSSPGSLVRKDGVWVLCLQTYPTPGNTTHGDDDSRIWTMRSRDLSHWDTPRLIAFLGPGVPRERMPRMIDPCIVADKDVPGKWWCFCKIKQTGVSMAWSNDLEIWHPEGRVDGGENACVIVQNDEYVLFHSPPNGIGVKRSSNLHEWRDGGVLTLGQAAWPWAKGRITAGFVFDARRVPGVERYLLFFHGSGPQDERTMFHTFASIGVAWSKDLQSWHWPGQLGESPGPGHGN
jgi:hypothetical protein